MTDPFSNVKLRLPKGFQTLLVGLSTEILRSQPRNIHEFAAEYFEKLLHQREQGEDSYTSGKQTNLEDRHHNDHNFEEEFSVDDPNIQHAATKIQAQFRGFKTRRELEKIKDKNSDEISHSNHHESNYDHEQTRAPNDEYQKPSDISNSHQNENVDDEIEFDENLTEEEKREQERAAISIQAQFRGYKTRKHIRDISGTSTEQQINHNDHDHNITSIEEIKTHENDQTDQSHLQVVNSDDFEIDDMSDPNLDKAATRIQASFRGYKTRKELGTTTGGSSSGHDQDQPSSDSSQTHEQYENARNKNILSPSAEGNKVPVGEEEEEEEEDNAAAVKIQAAYRGYRVRKDLEK
ncbi:hypothetical protein I4U23_020905 [Adineta vaga]|nr:hypothetical protein I4U23_020905 [Adineta vaga]